MKLLVVEDDKGIARTLSHVLSDYEVSLAHTGREGLSKIGMADYDLVTLDLNLPDMPGLEVCAQLRNRGLDIPILVLSCEVKVLSKIALLDAGADDYMTKPFSLGELKVRLRTLQRRALAAKPKPSCISSHGVVLDSEKHLVERDGQPVSLRRKEFALLECLLQNAGSVVSREKLGYHAWQDSELPWANTIDVHIKYLRDKIDRPFGSELIQTVHGLGYKFETAEPTTEQTGSMKVVS